MKSTVELELPKKAMNFGVIYTGLASGWIDGFPVPCKET